MYYNSLLMTWTKSPGFFLIKNFFHFRVLSKGLKEVPNLPGSVDCFYSIINLQIVQVFIVQN
jgi:hypothetical protein